MNRDAAPSPLDIGRIKAIWPPLLLGLIGGLALVVVFGELPGRPLILHVLQKLAHPSVFGLIAISVLVLLRQRAGGAGPVWREYLAALVAAILVGGLTEIAQLFAHRDPSLRDVGLDARGAAAALCLAAAFDARCRPSARGTWWKALYLAAGLALAALILMPLGWTIAAYANRSQRFPVLLEPASRLDLLFVSLGGSPSERIPLPAAYARSAGETALRVPLFVRPVAGVWLDEPSPDWSGRQALLVDVTNPGRSTLELHVRVHDRSHNFTADDRFNAVREIAPGRRETLAFPLETIASAPTGRRLDLRHVAGLALFRVGAEGPREFWLQRIELR